MNETKQRLDIDEDAVFCEKNTYAPRFLLSIVGTYFFGILFILIMRGTKMVIRRFNNQRRANEILRETWNIEVNKIKRSNTRDTLISVNSLDFDNAVIQMKRADMGCLYSFQSRVGKIYHFLHKWSIKILSYQSLPGKLFIHLTFVFSIISYLIYAVEEVRRGERLEKCFKSGRYTRLLDFIFHLFFLLHFIIRWTAANNSLTFWFDGLTAVDCCTIPPAIIGYILDRSWSGMRFLRIFRLINLAEVAHNLSIIKTVQALRLVRMTTLFIAIWLSGAGFFHLLENTGDPWKGYANKVSISYMDSIYFTMVTLSTVGYGDLTPNTDMGKFFVLIFILCALANFAKALPEIAGIVNLLNKYSGEYEKEADRPHVVVCGDVTTESVKHFLDDFLHKDRSNSDVEVVFINRRKPDIQLGSILKRNFVRVKYYQGTVMSHIDLERIKITEADACIVLANSQSKNEDEEDAANIMRVIAVKNYCPKVRIIVQLLHYNNKAFLLNIPSWNWNNGDEIICFSELKLGFLAQSCNALGFSTLLTNLFSMRSLHGANEAAMAVVEYECHNKDNQDGANVELNTFGKEKTSQQMKDQTSSDNENGNKTKFSRLKQKSIVLNEHINRMTESTGFFESDSFQETKWLTDYLRGVSMEIYSGKFSSRFCGLTFNEAAVFCKKKLDLILIAVVAKVAHENVDKDHILSSAELRGTEEKNESGSYSYYLAISPLSDNCSTIKYETIGFFICDSQEVANRALHYCSKCHDGLDSPDQIRQCYCNSRATGWRSRLSRAKETKKVVQMDSIVEEDEAVGGNNCQISFMPQLSETHAISDSNLRFDMTGMYHWCPTKSYEEVLLRSAKHPFKVIDTANTHLQNHIVLCIISDNESPLLGLRSFIMPLRSSNLHTKQLKPIILFGNGDYLEKEWPSISNLPQVFVFPGNPSSRTDLRAIRIQFSSVCVIVSSRNGFKSEDPYMIDKEVILCSLNIKAMKFPYDKMKADFINYKLPIRKTGADIPLITELCNDANIHYLDPQLKHFNISDNPVFVSPPFAKGIAFTTSVLDALASTAYFDRNNMTLIRHLVTGGVTPALELILAEGNDLEESQIDSCHLKQNRCRPRVDQIPISHPSLSCVTGGQFEAMSFEDLFVGCAQNLKILCLGIYRLSEDSSKDLWTNPKVTTPSKKRRLSTIAVPIDDMIRSQSIKPNTLNDFIGKEDDLVNEVSIIDRYVITNPPNSFLVRPTDLIYALCPFEFNTRIPGNNLNVG